MKINKLLAFSIVEAILGVTGLALVWATLGMWPAIGIFLCMFAMGVKSVFLLQQHVEEQHN